MDKYEAVQRMQDYIAEHLTERITPSELARAAMYSPWYAQRLFKELTGVAPADYVRRLKLSRSALRLRDGGCRITDVAFDMGFGSVDGYQRAFFREFGCNPGAYAARPTPIGLFTPYGVKGKQRKEVRSMDEVKSVFIKVIEKPARRVIVKRGVAADEYWTYCEEVGCDVWGVLTSMKSISGEPVCLWLPEQYRKPNTSEYVQGVEVEPDYDGPIPEGFDTVDLPAATYLQFQGEPFEEEDFMEAIGALKVAIDRYQPSAIGYRFDETNPRIQLEPIGTRGYIELMPITPIK